MREQVANSCDILDFEMWEISYGNVRYLRTQASACRASSIFWQSSNRPLEKVDIHKKGRRSLGGSILQKSKILQILFKLISPLEGWWVFTVTSQEDYYVKVTKRDCVPTSQDVAPSQFRLLCAGYSHLVNFISYLGRTSSRDTARMSVMLTKFESKSNRVKGIILCRF